MSDGNIIDQYYQGIYQQLHAEVNFINALFQHEGLKGEGNEVVLRELLTKFIPKRYGVGTGAVIDRSGQQSKQCDIVIYDTFQYPSLLSLASVHLFPVDIVYATIEVKTTLSSNEAQNALANIASVRCLKIIEQAFTLVPTANNSPIVGHNPRWQPPFYYPGPPIGFIFAYKSDVERFKTFKNWFIPRDDNNALNYPTVICCLDQGIVSFKNLYPQAGEQPEGRAYPLLTFSREGISDSVPSYVDPGTLSQREKKLYPIKTMKVPSRDDQSKQVEREQPIDPSRVLLNFILLLGELLSNKKISPDLSFLDHYVTFYTKSFLPQ